MVGKVDLWELGLVRLGDLGYLVETLWFGLWLDLRWVVGLNLSWFQFGPE